MNETSNETRNWQLLSLTLKYKANELRDTQEPWLYSNDVESLRAFVDLFGAESHQRTLQRILDFAERCS